MHHLAKANKTFGAGILPVMSELTPALWTRYLTDEAPPFGTHQSERYVDEANTAYAVDNLFNEDHAVTVVWLPETDSASHNDFRGQFGVARRSIVEADGLIGEMVAELRRRDRLKNTYLLLVSDHGHIGGRFGHLDRYDLVNEFFHQPARVDDSGNRVGGGLGLSVRIVTAIRRSAMTPTISFLLMRSEREPPAFTCLANTTVLATGRHRTRLQT